ncbi:leucine-rich repeat-containing protein 74B [Petaurus breviceps papuanus]|uniref:leucine-rich repeat-containing protein 74B n=1 Tax=Petaurus breviceps papuanus TaxID=3040969 RepID=UPI0036DB2076
MKFHGRKEEGFTPVREISFPRTRLERRGRTLKRVRRKLCSAGPQRTERGEGRGLAKHLKWAAFAGNELPTAAAIPAEAAIPLAHLRWRGVSSRDSDAPPPHAPTPRRTREHPPTLLPIPGPHGLLLAAAPPPASVQPQLQTPARQLRTMSGRGFGHGIRPLRAQRKPGPWGAPSGAMADQRPGPWGLAAASTLPSAIAPVEEEELEQREQNSRIQKLKKTGLEVVLKVHEDSPPKTPYSDLSTNLPLNCSLLQTKLEEEEEATSEPGGRPKGAYQKDSERDSDSDLEREVPLGPYDLTGRSQYLSACEAFGVVPISYFLHHMHDPELTLMHRGLGPQGARALASALMSNTSILKLNLSDNWLNEEGAAAIAGMLKENCFIADLDLSDNKLGVKGAKALCAALKENASVRRLRMSGSDLGTQAAKDIADALMVNTKVELLDLSHNLLDEKAGEKLGPALAENVCIKELNLSWNHLRSSGAVIFARGVGANIYLKVLDLSYNGFGDQGAAAMGEALKVNSVLEELNISNNRISLPGALRFSSGLRENRSLRILSMGRNPMRSEGCLGLLRAVQMNPDSGLEVLDFSDIHLNKDFDDLACSMKEGFPRLCIRHGSPTT